MYFDDCKLIIIETNKIANYYFVENINLELFYKHMKEDNQFSLRTTSSCYLQFSKPVDNYKWFPIYSIPEMEVRSVKFYELTRWMMINIDKPSEIFNDFAELPWGWTEAKCNDRYGKMPRKIVVIGIREDLEEEIFHFKLRWC